MEEKIIYRVTYIISDSPISVNIYDMDHLKSLINDIEVKGYSLVSIIQAPDHSPGQAMGGP